MLHYKGKQDNLTMLNLILIDFSFTNMSDILYNILDTVFVICLNN